MSGENWKKLRDTQYRQSELPLEREQPLAREVPKHNSHYEQEEMEEIVGPVDCYMAWIRHKEAMARRWFFGYYKHCKIERKKPKLIDQYNKICMMGKTRH